jgi:hypothetical protein
VEAERQQLIESRVGEHWSILLQWK